MQRTAEDSQARAHLVAHSIAASAVRALARHISATLQLCRRRCAPERPRSRRRGAGPATCLAAQPQPRTAAHLALGPGRVGADRIPHVGTHDGSAATLARCCRGRCSCRRGVLRDRLRARAAGGGTCRSGGTTVARAARLCARACIWGCNFRAALPLLAQQPPQRHQRRRSLRRLRRACRTGATSLRRALTQNEE